MKPTISEIEQLQSEGYGFSILPDGSIEEIVSPEKKPLEYRLAEIRANAKIAKECAIQPSTIIDLFTVIDTIGVQMKEPYIRQGCKRMIQEAIAGVIVTDEHSDLITSLSIGDIAEKVIGVFTK
jgi:hypothetical protein